MKDVGEEANVIKNDPIIAKNSMLIITFERL
jgi:hypothetical protein